MTKFFSKCYDGVFEHENVFIFLFKPCFITHNRQWAFIVFHFPQLSFIRYVSFLWLFWQRRASQLSSHKIFYANLRKVEISCFENQTVLFTGHRKNIFASLKPCLMTSRRFTEKGSAGTQRSTQSKSQGRQKNQ